MEFGEKLQTLRKGKGLTQEELAQILHVSRTAVSKWESGRGYPGIDSLKDIASFFSVTIDELLTGEKILSLAEKEKAQTLQKMCSLLFGSADLFALMLMVLPLYPHAVNGNVYSVNLFRYSQAASLTVTVYWILFLGLVFFGILRILLTCFGISKGQGLVTWGSVIFNILAVLFLSITRQSYATVVVFSLFLIKGILCLKYVRV